MTPDTPPPWRTPRYERLCSSCVYSVDGHLLLTLAARPSAPPNLISLVVGGGAKLGSVKANGNSTAIEWCACVSVNQIFTNEPIPTFLIYGTII